MRKKIAILGLILILGLGKLVMAEVWQKIKTSGTPPDKRNGHVLISPGGNEQFIFGGFGQNNDLWILREEGESSRWERKDVPGTVPSARGGHSGIFVPEDGAVVEDSIIIFGGSQSFEGTLVNSKTYQLEDPWSWNWNPIWEELPTGGAAPSSRAEHTAVYDDNNNMIVFGGYTSITPVVASNKTYTLDFSTSVAWAELTPVGDIPPARYGHSAVWGEEMGMRQMIVFGGKDSSGELLNDCWRLEWLNNWYEIDVNGDKPPARWQHTAVWIQGQFPEPGKMIVFGGEDENENHLDDVWVLQRPPGEPNWKWEELYPIGDLPSGRSGHAVASGWGWGWGWDGEEKMFIFGGSDGNNSLNDVYAFARGEKVKETLQEKPFNAPNPFNPDTEETKICYYLDDDESVKIKLFTLTGDLVYSWENISGREGLNQWPWNGKNEKGRIVENGGYICLIEAGGKKQKCKIAVLR